MESPQPERRKPGPSPAKRSAPGRERRQHRRARADWPVTVEIDGSLHEAKIRDVSHTGVCFFLDRPIGEMTLLHVEFDLPVESGIRRIRGKGAVVRCERIARNLEHYEIAVFMHEMAPPDRWTIDSYVHKDDG